MLIKRGYEKFRVPGTPNTWAKHLLEGEDRYEILFEAVDQEHQVAREGRIIRSVIAAEDGTTRMDTVNWENKDRQILKEVLDKGSIGWNGLPP